MQADQFPFKSSVFISKMKTISFPKQRIVKHPSLALVCIHLNYHLLLNIKWKPKQTWSAWVSREHRRHPEWHNSGLYSAANACSYTSPAPHPWLASALVHTHERSVQFQSLYWIDSFERHESGLNDSSVKGVGSFVWMTMGNISIKVTHIYKNKDTLSRYVYSIHLYFI